MSQIFSSATKIVLLMFALTLCSGFLLGRIEAVVFIPVATLVFGSYFGNPNKTVPATDKVTPDPVVPTV